MNGNIPPDASASEWCNRARYDRPTDIDQGRTRFER